MRLNLILDPRTDPLERARLGELQNFAKESGVEFDASYGAPVIRELLRRAGKTNIKPPDRQLGSIHQPAVTPTSHKAGSAPAPKREEIPTVNALDNLLAQQMVKSSDQMTITELRQACKAKGIKLARTDNMVTLKAKLDGQDAA